MRTFAAAGTTFIILITMAAMVSAQNPGHPPSQIGPGTFAGSGTWTFPGTVAATSVCIAGDCRTVWPTGGTSSCSCSDAQCSCPAGSSQWSAGTYGIYYGSASSGNVGIGASPRSAYKLDVTGNIYATGTICNAAGCVGSSGTSYWNAATLGGTSGIKYDGYIGAAKYCDTGGTTCKTISEMGGTGTCTCPSIWTEPAAGRTYYMGSVGIGTSSQPNAKLQVAQDATHWISLDPYYSSSYQTIRTSGGLYIRAGDAGYTQYMTSDTLGTNQLTLGYSYPSTPAIRTYNSGQDLTIAPQGGDTSVTGNIAATGNVAAAGSLRAPQICDETGANCKDISTGWSTGTASQWVTGQYGIYYTSSPNKVGINGQPGPNTLNLYVNGPVGASQYCDGSAGSCVTPASVYSLVNSPLWTASGSNIYRSSGTVGIGTTSPTTSLKLDVEGQVGATQYCDENGASCFDIVNANTVQCPPKRVSVDEVSSNWDEFATYSTCQQLSDSSGPYVRLSGPQICDGGNCYYIRNVGDAHTSSRTEKYCNEFGLQDYDCGASITTASVQAYVVNADDRWERNTYGGDYYNRACCKKFS